MRSIQRPARPYATAATPDESVPLEATTAHGEEVPLRSGMPDKLILTVSEAAVCLGISRAFAYELANRREIPAIRLGRRLLVPREQLLRFISAASKTDE